MAFVPATSLPSGGVAANVTVTNFPATYDISDRAARLLGHVTVDNASLAVTGPMTDAEFSAHLPLAVTGPLTAAELVAAEPISVTGDSSSTGGATEQTLEELVQTAENQELVLRLFASKMLETDLTDVVP